MIGSVPTSVKPHPTKPAVPTFPALKKFAPGPIERLE